MVNGYQSDVKYYMQLLNEIHIPRTNLSFQITVAKAIQSVYNKTPWFYCILKK
jgi:hypothetical protein